MTVVKHSFGGLGSIWVNPALGGWLFIRLSWPASFANALENGPLTQLPGLVLEGLTDPLGSPLGILSQAGRDISGYHLFQMLPLGSRAEYLLSPLRSLDVTIFSLLNNTVFSLLGIELPLSYSGLFLFSGPGIIADRGVFMLLLGTVIITASQAGRAWIPPLFLAVYTALVRIHGGVPFGGALGSGDILFSLCTGGVFVAAFLLISDPATGPKSAAGAALGALVSGAFAYIFRYLGMEPYGAFFAVILMNILVPLIRLFEGRWMYRKELLS
jgi:electron transport complex protein RnfD